MDASMQSRIGEIEHTPEPRDQSFDVVVLGAGLSGLGAGWTALHAGASVLVLEKAPTIGGSSALSAGMFWTAPDLTSFEKRIPLGDRTLARRVVGDYPAALDEIRASGVDVAPTPKLDVMGFGTGYTIDIRAYLDLLAAEIREGGGEIRTSTTVSSVEQTSQGFALTTDSGTVIARSVTLATGGFQGSASKLAEHMGENAAHLVHRANPVSAGDGLDLARSLGAATAGNLSTFYGHLLPSPMTSFEPADYLPYSQYYSDHTILVNRNGRRFVDETLGDELVNQDALRQPGGTAVMIFDQHVRETYGTAEPFPNFGLLDRYQAAVDAGAHHIEAASLGELIARIGELDVDVKQLGHTVRAYTDAVTYSRAEADGIPVSPLARIPSKAPFYALEVQPSITFTLGGIRVDDNARVLDTDHQVIPGLFAVGADIGGLSNYAYAGGLAPGYILGRWAGHAAAAHARASAGDRRMGAVR